MAIIGRIRNMRYLLVGITGLALLTFILTGLFDKIGSSVESGNYGTIDGEVVDTAIYNSKLIQFQNTDRQQVEQQQQRQYNDQDAEQSADKAWSATVDEIVLNGEYEALGLTVSEKEFTSFLFGEDGFSLIPEIQQNFSDPNTGQFNAAQLTKYIEEQEKSTDATAVANWKKTKEAIRNQRMQEKYFQFLGQGAYVTKLEAKNEYLAKNESKSISFVVGQFREIKDEDVKVSDKEIRDYYEKNKEKPKYQVMAGRDVKFFDIAIEPSKSDIDTFNLEMKKIKTAFAASTNDSLFILQNSELPRMYASGNQLTFRPEGDAKARQGMTYPVAMDTVFKTATVGQIVGPYDDKGKTRIAKVLGFNSTVLKARHILINAPEGDAKKVASAKKLADSLVKLVNNANFAEFVTKYSEDQGSKEKGGVYEDFMDYEMVEPFSKFAMEKPIGTIGVVKTQFGFHIMEVMDRKAGSKFPVLAVVEKTMLPSEDTKADLKDKAYTLLAKLDRELEKKSDITDKVILFDTIARKAGYYSRPLRMFDESPKVQGFVTKMAIQTILELAYNDEAKVGDMCSAPIQDDKRLVIAMVSSIREKGVPQLVDVYERMRTDAMNEKRANKILKKIGSVTNLEVLAKKLKTEVMNAEVTFATPSIQGGGYEPEVIGALFSGKIKDKSSSKATVGQSGVYVIRVNKSVKAQTVTSYDAEKMQMLSQIKGSIANVSRQALQKKMNVMDNRALLDAGIIR
ncbi:peptidylprolyl isomerase [Fluviicola taffensis]|uniref:Periplasmic chaperone PpiD n=1 Tax=Fluviicola taffensis (strain DSM 16823 / NCIMB 13979 / RW262) TaxID=755732 RepID=F2IJT2_FLUTR|nr:peptidylprolyl isomerase [Fluviicola taffensis]AEA43972.1 PpiC-type peptidyl-prolyl cis-trans isomerase [Fluviicola taffensis DSM 16823]